jgi:hypothetical protein
LDQDVPPLLLAYMLDLQSNHFKMTMLHNFEAILCEENQLIPLQSFGSKSPHLLSSTSTS